MRWLIVVLAILLLVLQYRLWIGEGSLAQRAELRRTASQQQARNERLAERNNILAGEVAALKNGLDALEERARHDLGMVREGETFYLVVDEPIKPLQQAPSPSPQPVEDAIEGKVPLDALPEPELPPETQP